jgi:hemoglobin
MQFRSFAQALSLSLVLAFTSLPAKAEDSLYSQLGGYDGIATVTDAFLTKLGKDKKLGRFFVGHSDSSLRRIRQDIVEFLCEKSGGPCFYTGRSMKEAHAGLRISKEDWKTSNKLFGEVMNELKVDKKLQGKVVEFVSTLEKDIVER